MLLTSFLIAWYMASWIPTVQMHLILSGFKATEVTDVLGVPKVGKAPSNQGNAQEDHKIVHNN